MNQTNKSGKKLYIEYLRCMAMFGVVLAHVCITARTDFPDHNRYEEAFAVGVTNILHFAVPVFFMITGALFLNPAKKITIDKLLKKYTSKYALGILVFGWGFALMEQLFDGFNNLPHKVGKSFVLMLEGKSWNHMWYLYALVGIMLSMPIWKMVVQVCEQEKNMLMLRYIVICIFVFNSVLVFLDEITGCHIDITFPVGVIYIGYLFLGYMIDREYIKIKRITALIMTLGAGAVIIFGSCVYAIKGYEWGQDIGKYTSPFILILSVGIFVLGKDIIADKCGGEHKVLSFISKQSYGVYIMHMFVINVLYKLLKISPFGNGMVVKVAIFWMVTSAVSIVMVAIGRKIPVIGKLL